MDQQNSESYEFLDLSDVNDTERKEIIKTLYQNKHIYKKQPTRTTTVTTSTTTTTTSQLQHHNNIATITTSTSSNFHPQIVFFPPPQQHFYIHPQFDPSLLQHQQHHNQQHLQQPHQIYHHHHHHHHNSNDQQQQSSTSASETTIYRSSSISNCSDSTSDCVTPSGSILNLTDNISNSNNKLTTTKVTTIRGSTVSSATNINSGIHPPPPPPTYSAVVYGGVSRGGGNSGGIGVAATTLTHNRQIFTSNSSNKRHFNGNDLSNNQNKHLDDDYDNHYQQHHHKPRHYKRYVKQTHVDHSIQNIKSKSSASGSSNNSNTKTSTTTYSAKNSSTSNMTQQQQQQQQQTQSQQAVVPQPQNVPPQSNNNGNGNQQPSNGNAVSSNSVSNFHPHGGYGSVPYTVHHGGHGIYPTVIPTTLPPGNVYVNNVTANVNVGWTGHPSVQAAYIPNSQSYIAAGSSGHPVEVVGDQAPVMQPVHMSMPVRNRTPHRGRGRGGPNSNSSRRSEYNPRQQQDSPNPAPQTAQQRSDRGSGANNNNIPPQQQQNSHQQQQTPQQIESGTQATLAAYPSYAYQYIPTTFYGHQGIVHSQTATTAQNVTGAPLYVTQYMGHPALYNYPVMYSPVVQPDYHLYDDNGETMYYAPIQESDINQNAASGETQILSPGYPIYDQQMHEMHQQMSGMHIYDPQAQQAPHMGGPIVEIEQGAENMQIGEQMISPHEQETGIVATGPPPQEGAPFILTPVTVDNQLNNSGSDDQSVLETMSHHSNEMMMPIEIATQIQPVPISVPYIPAMEPQQSPVTYETVSEPQTVPKEVVTVVGHDFNQNQMPSAPVNIETEIQPHIPQQIPIESISFQPNVIEETKIEEVSIQLETAAAAVQIESTTSLNSSSTLISNNHVEEISTTTTIPNIVDVAIVQATITKSMSWTNQQQQQPQLPTPAQHHHHYNKKSTASVAVTATPTPSNGKPFTPSTKQQTASTTTTPSPQVKNHGAMKTPSSPVGVGQTNNTSSTKGTTTSTSTASSTAVPQQLQEPKKTTTKSQGNLVFTPPITTPTPQPIPNNTWASLFNKTPSTTNFTTSTSSPAATTPIQNNNNNNNFALPATNSQTNTTNSNNNATSTTPVSVKPIAKVAPYESGAVSQTSSSPAQPPQTINHTNNSYSTNPGALSYSAASTQSLSPAVSGGVQTNNNNSITNKTRPQNSVASTVNNNNKAATTNTNSSNSSTSITNNKNQTSNACGDEWTFKLARFLTKYKTDFNAVSLKPRGLMNKSNYCYINSILQALIGCPPFYNLLKSLPKQPTALQTEIKTPTLNAMVQLATEFSTLPPGVRLNFNKKEKVQKDGRTIKDDNNGGTDLQCDSAFEPSAIYKLWNLTRSDAEGRQEDAEEFLCFILNKLNDEMLEVVKLVNKPPQAPKENGEGDDGEDWQVIANGKSSVFRQTDYGRTPLSDIFRGETRSRLQREGGTSNDAVQPFYTLQLNIEKAASVREALDLLVGREQLEGFSCSKTNQEVVAWQQMTLEKLPVVLILHLKWFDYKGDGCSKILKNVDFPVELVLDSKIMTTKKNPKARTYRLFAVVYHDGKEATKGHYITDVYHPGYLNWLRFDDSSVKPISENTVLYPSLPRVPYLLLYRRSDTFVPGQPEHHSTLAAHKKNNQK